MLDFSFSVFSEAVPATFFAAVRLVAEIFFVSVFGFFTAFDASVFPDVCAFFDTGDEDVFFTVFFAGAFFSVFFADAFFSVAFDGFFDTDFFAGSFFVAILFHDG